MLVAIGDAPLNPSLTGIWMQLNQQQQPQDFGQPPGQAGADGADESDDGNDPDGGGPGAVGGGDDGGAGGGGDGAGGDAGPDAEGGAPADGQDDGESMAKAAAGGNPNHDPLTGKFTNAASAGSHVSTAPVETGPGGTDHHDHGPFGPIFHGFTNNPEGAIQRLMDFKSGEVPDAFIHPELGPIAFVYGDEKMGLRHIEAKRGMQWVLRIPEILRNGRLERDQKVPRAFIVDGASHSNVAVIRLDWDGQQKVWLVTAHPDDEGKWSGAGKTSRTAGDVAGSVQGNPSRSIPHDHSTDDSDSLKAQMIGDPLASVRFAKAIGMPPVIRIRLPGDDA